MTNATYHLAEFNIVRMLAPLTDPVMADLVNNFDPINALADSAPGFIWRLQTDEGNATSIRIYDDDYFLINLSVWDSLDSLFAFTYQSDHVRFFRRRREWFEKLDLPIIALWWIPAGHIPTPQEGQERLEYLRQHGPTPHAFTFKERFGAEEMLSATTQG